MNFSSHSNLLAGTVLFVVQGVPIAPSRREIELPEREVWHLHRASAPATNRLATALIEAVHTGDYAETYRVIRAAINDPQSNAAVWGVAVIVAMTRCLQPHPPALATTPEPTP